MLILLVAALASSDCALETFTHPDLPYQGNTKSRISGSPNSATPVAIFTLPKTGSAAYDRLPLLLLGLRALMPHRGVRLRALSRCLHLRGPDERGFSSQ